MSSESGTGCFPLKLSWIRLVPRLWAVWLPGAIMVLVLVVSGKVPPLFTVFMLIGFVFVALWSAFIFSLGFRLEICEVGLKRELPSLNFVFMGGRLVEEVAWAEVETIKSMWFLPLVKIRRKSKLMPFLAPKKSVIVNSESMNSFLEKINYPFLQSWK